MLRRGRRVQPPAAASKPATAWSTEDKSTLQKRLDPLHNRFRKQPLGFLTSEGSSLLCTPPDQIYDRLTSFLSNVSIVSGLVLSAIAGAALSPLDIDDFPAEKRGAAEAYNVVAALTVAIQLCVVLYSTFTLYILISASHNATAVYRSLTHMSKWLGFLEFATFIPALGSFGLIILAAHLRCGMTASYIVLGCCCALIVVFQAWFIVMCTHSFPYNAWAWSSVFGGFLWLSGRLQAEAKTHGELLVSQAKDGVLGGMDEDGDFVIDDLESKDQANQAADEAQAELTSWVHEALDLKPTRHEALVKGLLAAGLTRARMLEAVRFPSGFQTLCAMLDRDDLGLRPGDRLALASAAMRAGAEPAAGLS
jgi:hypothetical protein